MIACWGEKGGQTKREREEVEGKLLSKLIKRQRDPKATHKKPTNLSSKELTESRLIVTEPTSDQPRPCTYI